MTTATEDRLPYHDGERRVQERAGVAHKAAAVRQGIRPFMPDQHRDFFQQLPFVILGSEDVSHNLWASILVGAPGFLQSPDPFTLEVAAKALPGDPLSDHLKAGARLGLLGIQPETRRRNRMNGHVEVAVPQGFVITVDQSFGNCPQYIQAREPLFQADLPAPSKATEGPSLSAAAKDLITRSDTFFIATSARDIDTQDPADGIDVSHRGGKPGFVHVAEVDGHTVLTAPDFRGNNMFMTLGNIESNPKSGLVFIDFESGDILQLTGHAEIIWDDAAIAAFTGAQRLLRFHVARGHVLKAALPFRWSEAELSPQSAKTGDWGDVA